MKNACSIWAGSLAMLCGILGLTSWKTTVMILNKLLILLSITCVLLSLAGLVLGCQDIEVLSRVPRCNLMDKENKTCFSCEEINLTKCTEVETVLKAYCVKSCSSAHLHLKKVLLGLCALNALTTTVCLTAVALHFWQIFESRRSCLGELQTEDQDDSLDPDGFVPLVPPPSYFAACNSGPPQTSHRTPGLSLPHAYAMRINGAEVFFRLEPPPPYEDVQSSNTSEQGDALQINVMNSVDLVEVSEGQDSQGDGTCLGGHVIESPCVTFQLASWRGPDYFYHR
ncbi:protein FAM189A2 isoform X1 [Manacus vitellinus]|uniref:protein FAM189A2 isoform X1 n=1 Tax=Manacus vitellinus TaxID=328815 RepID=UPI0008471562|nr:protein FAM189A2 isoform X1 [Manacus vitellinus]